MNDKSFIIKMATKAALIDGYDHVIIEEIDGDYSHCRNYKNCCPDWLGKIVGVVKTSWNSGILKTQYETI